MSPFGLYIHVPFCSRLCHYCDFVKTARHDGALQTAYLRALQRRTQEWLRFWTELSPDRDVFTSVFLGGGTPSLLGSEYEALFDQIRPRLAPETEVTLEANPEHISHDKLKIWSDLGINRLSLGVQSFQPDALRFLTREHSPEEARRAVAAARELIPNVNIDLIYGWPEQTRAQWESDLDQAIALGAEHLSLYTLTYEGQTPMARRMRRGKLAPQVDESLESLYTLACQRLAAAGYLHEEVSNWAKPSALSRHNAIYWNGGSYLGVGSGAHSYLEQQGPWGLRWQQNSNWKNFAEERTSEARSIAEILARPDCQHETDRDAEGWILEVVSSALRTRKGLNLDAICAKTGYCLKPRPSVRFGLDQGLLRPSPDGYLTLAETEWYRETQWALEVSLSLQPT